MNEAIGYSQLRRHYRHLLDSIGDGEDGIVENKDGNKLKEAIKQVRKQGFK